MGIVTAIAAGNHIEAQWLIYERFGVELPEQKAEYLTALAHTLDYVGKGEFDREWSDGTLFMWIKIRLDELGLLDVPHRTPANVSLTVKLHTGFIFIVETEEQLIRLASHERRIQPGFARSKISTTQIDINPVDRVAQRVAPKPEDNA